MKDFSFYDQMGNLIPGSVLLMGLLVMFPHFKDGFSSHDISVGALGLFLIVAYVLGHLLSFGTWIVETIMWWPFGGKPSSWIAGKSDAWLFKDKKGWLLKPDVVDEVQGKLKARLGLDVSIKDAEQKDWQRYFGAIYSDAFANQQGDRITVFNAMYNMSGGIAIALIILAVLCGWRGIADWPWGLAAAAAVFIGRMASFGLHFAKEVYYVFIRLPGGVKAEGARQ
jgi:hypothetical protein